MSVLFYDVETKSQLDLKQVGAYRYAADKTTEILCVGYALDDGPLKIWTPGESMPKEVTINIKKGGLWVAFNAAFERQIHWKILKPRFAWPFPDVNQYRCMMAAGLALALPGSLEKILDAMKLGTVKDKAGKRVMMQMTKPRKARKGEDPDAIHWHDDDVRSGQLQRYCMDDVAGARELYYKLWPLSDAEQSVWELDQRINDRGFHVDEQLLLAMRRIITDAGIDINRQILKKTNGAVTTVDEVANIKAWLQSEHDVTIETLDKKTIPEVLKTPIPKVAKEVLELRMAGAQAAVKKVNAFLERRDKDGRVRGSFIYHSAGPGRWSSRGAQVHNLKRLAEEDEEDIEAAVKTLQTGNYKLIKLDHARPLKLVGDNIRTVIDAAPGHVLIGADFSGIEARITAWLAGEERKLQVFRDYDAGKGPDPYIVAAAGIYGISISEVDKPKRQVGKAGELAFGFQGGVNAYKKFVPEGLFTDQEIDGFKIKWRKQHPNIEAYWHALGDTARKIAQHANWLKKGTYDRVLDPIPVKSVWFEYENEFMFIVLPSGRRIAYPFVGRMLRARERYYIQKPEDKQEYLDSYFMDNSSGRWHHVFLYGGLLTENIVQGVARDILAEAMVRVEQAGLPIVAHIHDEAVIEVPKAQAKAATALFVKLMTRLPPWARADKGFNIPELPLVAKAWCSQRYTK